MLARSFISRSLAAGGILSVLGTTVLPTAGQQAVSLPRPPGGRVVTLPRSPADKPQETAVAVNPRDPRQVVVSFHQAVGARTDHHFGMSVEAHVAWSADGGTSWAIAPGTTHPKHLRTLDATVAFDLHGHAFLSFLAMDSISATTRHGQYLRSSLVGGRTWGPLITLMERPGKQEPVLEHFPNLVVDNHAASRYAGNLYVIWDRQFAGDKTDMMLTRSVDDGKSWSPPKVITKHDTRIAHTAAVGPDGTIYLIFMTMFASGVDVMREASRDAGETFDPPRRVSTLTSNPERVAEFPRVVEIPNIAVDAQGRLFAVWGDSRNGDADVFSSTSGDGGRTWTSPVRVNDDISSNGKDQVLHWLAVDHTDGAAYVLFYDRRGDPKNLLPTMTLARSIDGGKSFVNYAWTVTPSDPNQANLGDYIGLAAAGGRVYGAWPENVPGPMPAKLPPSVAPSDTYYVKWPLGTSAIRVGIADFRASATRSSGSPGQ